MNLYLLCCSSSTLSLSSALSSPAMKASTSSTKCAEGIPEKEVCPEGGEGASNRAAEDDMARAAVAVGVRANEISSRCEHCSGSQPVHAANQSGQMATAHRKVFNIEV